MKYVLILSLLLVGCEATVNVNMPTPPPEVQVATPSAGKEKPDVAGNVVSIPSPEPSESPTPPPQNTFIQIKYPYPDGKNICRITMAFPHGDVTAYEALTMYKYSCDIYDTGRVVGDDFHPNYIIDCDSSNRNRVCYTHVDHNISTEYCVNPGYTWAWFIPKGCAWNPGGEYPWSPSLSEYHKIGQ